MNRRIDEIDATILSILRDDATTPKAEIARKVRLAPSAVFARIQRLERLGVIQGYTTRVDSSALGLPVLAFIFVTERKPVRGKPTAKQLAALKDVEEVHRIAGEACFLLKVRCASNDALAKLLDRMAAIPSVASTRTTIVLSTIAQ